MRSNASIRPPQAPCRDSAGLPWRGYAVRLAIVALMLIAGCQRQSDEQSISTITELTNANFQRKVIESDQPVLVEFWAPWCQPCIEMLPALEQIAEEFSGRATVGKIRIDEYEELASSFEVESPPTVIVFRNGRVFKRRSGLQSADSLRALLDTALASTTVVADSEIAAVDSANSWEGEPPPLHEGLACQ